MEKSIDIGKITLAGSSVQHERVDAVANRRLILAAAEDLFSQNGVEQVSMADIAIAAGVGKGTLYRRFASKGELCLALLDNQLLTYQNELLADLREQSAAKVPYLQQLAHFLDTLVYFTGNHLPLLCEVQRMGLLETNQQQQMPHVWRYMTILGLLQGARKAGEVSPDLDLEYTADALLAPLWAPIFRFQREGRQFSLERISEGLQNLIFALKAH